MSEIVRIDRRSGWKVWLERAAFYLLVLATVAVLVFVAAVVVGKIPITDAG